jgi:hypothetical protein
MKFENTNEVLRYVRDEYSLTVREIARLARAKSLDTVRAWLIVKPKSDRFRTMSDASLELLLIRLNDEPEMLARAKKPKGKKS